MISTIAQLWLANDGEICNHGNRRAVSRGSFQGEFKISDFRFFLSLCQVNQAPVSRDTTKLVGYGNTVSNSSVKHGMWPRWAEQVEWWFSPQVRSWGQQRNVSQSLSGKTKVQAPTYAATSPHIWSLPTEKSQSCPKLRNQWDDYISENQRHPHSISHPGVDQVD